MRRRSEFEVLEKTFLGGKVSDKYEEFGLFARMSPTFADAYIILDRLPELISMENSLEFIKKLLLILGESDSMYGYDELTRLSMIMGELAEKADLSKRIPIKRKF